MDLAAKKLAHEAEVAELGSKLAWVKPTLATHVTYDETKDLHAYWPRRAEPSAEAQARMDEISDRMTEIAEILDAPDDGDDVEALEAEYNALDAEHDRLADTDLLIPEEDKPNVGTFLVLGKDGQPRLLETYYTSSPRGGPLHRASPERGRDRGRGTRAFGQPAALARRADGQGSPRRAGAPHRP
jgi:ParB family chromosome partitioning protein